MNREQFSKLKRGDVVQHKEAGEIFVIAHDLGATKIAVRTLCLHNPGEWDRINPSTVKVMR